MEEMEHLGLHHSQLRLINLKDFNFPQLSYYLDHNRFSDEDPEFSVWFHRPGDHDSHYVYSSSNSREWDAVRSEIRIWNASPKEYWKKALTEAYKRQIDSDQAAILLHKKSRKSALKALDKLERID